MSLRTPDLLELPLEIFRAILSEAVRVRGLKRALRLRLVNQTFSTELIAAFCDSGLIDQCWVSLNDWPLARPYITRLVLEKATKGIPRLQTICRIAEILAAQEGDSAKLTCARGTSGDDQLLARILQDSVSQFVRLKYEEWAIKLLDLAATCGGQQVRVLLSKKSLEVPRYREIIEKRFNYDLLSSAAFANNIQICRGLVDSELKIELNTFGDPFKAAVRGRSYEVLTLFLEAEERKKHAILRYSGSVRLIGIAAESGDAPLVRWLLDSGYNPGGTMLKDHKLLRTPSIEVFEMMMEEPQLKKRPFPKTADLNGLLCYAIGKGWVDMVKHLINLGAPLDVPFQNCGASACPLYWACRARNQEIVQILLDNGAAIEGGKELFIAAKQGLVSIVRMLLERGAPVIKFPKVRLEYQSFALYGAASSGSLQTVRVLLDAGVNPNCGGHSPRDGEDRLCPFIGALDSEHNGIFRLLVERGADTACVSSGLAKAGRGWRSEWNPREYRGLAR